MSNSWNGSPDQQQGDLQNPLRLDEEQLNFAIPGSSSQVISISAESLLMDSNDGRPSQAEPLPSMDVGDWRSELLPDSRQKIINKIMETLQRHLPVSGEEGLQELREIAVRFEGKIYDVAASQSDYLRKISLKLTMMS